MFAFICFVPIKKKKKLSFASVKKVKVVLNKNKAVGRGETEQSRTVKALEEVSVD